MGRFTVWRAFEMSLAFVKRHALPIAFAALLAGCNNAATSLVMGGPHQAIMGVAAKSARLAVTPDATGLVLYEGSYNYQPGVGQVLVWPASLNAHPSSPIRSITANTVRPEGMWVDGNGD